MIIDEHDLTEQLPQIRAAYPHCALAVALCELIGESIFANFRQHNTNLPDALVFIRRGVQRASDGLVCQSIGTKADWQEIANQMEHPDFCNYVRAKLGML